MAGNPLQLGYGVHDARSDSASDAKRRDCVFSDVSRAID